ncbi:GNAT family N-acetyltransferase [Roseibium aestuarii]|uniref:GNAT family N-acetyltransferase n=1 Tax=Roseibium aestuarii TaxID=2600299 RepID=A0ABW4K0D0_9HYPH|nr:GNAT family N-acetyltransferase [Roseibium aestuarii]
MTRQDHDDTHRAAPTGVAGQEEPVEAQLALISSLDQIPAPVWDSVANPGWTVEASGRPAPDPGLESPSQETSFNPFLTHAFLQSLEESGCVRPETGWIPRHLILQQGDEVLGAVPAYLKTHSQGEYVFDHGWADAFERAGGAYYPKLQVSVPFTPATGRRFLTSPAIARAAGIEALSAGLVEVCRRSGASSVHATFLTTDEWQALGAAGYLQRTDSQFHFENPGYESFDAFLAELNSRKRKDIRKERQGALEAGIEIEWVTGSDLKEHHWDAFYAFYVDTGSRKWGRPYLNRRFFSLISERMAGQILLVLARREGRYIAGALNFIGSDTLFGRNWGCIEHHPFLHFEVCYYQAIDFAIQRGLSRVEAGAQGAHKLARGYVPSQTRSAHWIAHPGLRDAVADFLTHERRMVEREAEALATHAPFRKA